MNYKPHIIKNFPEGYPIWKKAVANIIFSIRRIIVFRRENNLTKNDKAEVSKIMKKGDVILVGGLRRFSHFFIGDRFTHSLICEGNKKLIHVVADGVEEVGLDDIFIEYDTMIVLRPNMDKNIINKAVKYAKAQLGKPYDFEFTKDDNKFYCAELVQKSFLNAGYKIKYRRKIIYPIDLIEDKFVVKFVSESLKRSNFLS